MAAVAAKKSVFDELGVQVLAISADSRFTHKIWQEEELAKMVPGGFPYPMLTDPAGRIGAAYGVYDEAAAVDMRGRFIITPEGNIVAYEVLTPDVGRFVGETIRQIQAYQHVAATGEVTPAGWRPGKKTLKPGPALVGKVWMEWKIEMAFD